MTSPITGLNDGVVKQLLNVGASFAAIQVATDVLEKASFDDDDVAAIGWLPADLRAETVARLIDAAESLREELLELEGRLLVLAPVPTG